MADIIKSVKLDLGKKEITLTVEQCKKLKAALDEMFGKEVIKEVFRDNLPFQWWPPTYPWHWNPEPPDKIWVATNTTASFSDGDLTLAVA